MCNVDTESFRFVQQAEQDGNSDDNGHIAQVYRYTDHREGVLCTLAD